MTTPEGNRDNRDIWDDLLKDVDMTGITGPDSLMDLLYHDQSGTPHQNAVYQLFRKKIEPFERYFNRQAEAFVTSKKLPRGVKRTGNDYSFELVVDDDHYSAHMVIPQGSNRWLHPWANQSQPYRMKLFGLDGSHIAFDDNGSISEVKLSLLSKVPKIDRARNSYTPKNSDVVLYVHNPTDMGLYTVNAGNQVYSRIQGDGILTDFRWHEKMPDENKRHYFAAVFEEAVSAVCPANITPTRDS